MYIYHGSANGIELKYRQVYELFTPFYRCGGHIELIGFKKYYTMPRGMSAFRLYLGAFFGAFFLKVLSE